MTKTELENIKITKRWKVTFADFYSRYFFVLFPLGIVYAGLTMTKSGFNNRGTDSRIESIIILIIGLFLTVFVVKRLYQNQMFSCFRVQGLTRDKVELALKNTKLRDIKYHRLGYFTAMTNKSWFSWGEQITIIIDADDVLINSRPTGSVLSFQPITIFKDRQNIKTIVSALQF